MPQHTPSEWKRKKGRVDKKYNTNNREYTGSRAEDGASSKEGARVLAIEPPSEKKGET